MLKIVLELESNPSLLETVIEISISKNVQGKVILKEILPIFLINLYFLINLSEQNNIKGRLRTHHAKFKTFETMKTHKFLSNTCQVDGQEFFSFFNFVTCNFFN